MQFMQIMLDEKKGGKEPRMPSNVHLNVFPLSMVFKIAYRVLKAVKTVFKQNILLGKTSVEKICDHEKQRKKIEFLSAVDISINSPILSFSFNSNMHFTSNKI